MGSNGASEFLVVVRQVDRSDGGWRLWNVECKDASPSLGDPTTRPARKSSLAKLRLSGWIDRIKSKRDRLANFYGGLNELLQLSSEFLDSPAEFFV